MRRVDYDRRLHAVYASGRTMSSATLQAWMDAFARRLPSRRPLSMLDLGSGVGRLTPALAETFGGPITGVEPSDKMRAQAEAGATHPKVAYLAGSAESIPLPTASCDAALLYLVWHHVADKRGAADELHRVVRPTGRLLVRTNLSDRMPDLWWYRWFPRACEVDRQMYRTLEQTVSDFTASGWSMVALDAIETTTASSVQEEFERLRTRALSTFEHLTDGEIEEGFAAIQAALPEIDHTGGLRTRSDVIVLER